MFKAVGSTVTFVMLVAFAALDRRFGDPATQFMIVALGAVAAWTWSLWAAGRQDPRDPDEGA